MKDGILPWTRSCFVCGENNPQGLHLRCRVEKDRTVLEYVTRYTDSGYYKMVHGGIMGTLLDEVMTWAAILAMRKICVAAEFTLRFLSPAELGEKLRVEGWVTRSSARLCLTQGIIKDLKGKSVVHSTGKFMPMPFNRARMISEDFVFSSESYLPDDIISGSRESLENKNL